MNYGTSTHRARFTYADAAAVARAKAARPSNRPDRVSAEEEDAAMRSCAALLLAMHPRLGLGPQHGSFRAAVHYLRRVFAARSLAELDPVLVALASLFVAGKVLEVRWPRGAHGSLHYRGFTVDRILRAYADVAGGARDEERESDADADADADAAADADSDADADARRPPTALDVLVYERVVLETLGFSLVVHPPPRVTGSPTLERAEAALLLRGDAAALAMTPDQLADAVADAARRGDGVGPDDALAFAGPLDAAALAKFAALRRETEAAMDVLEAARGTRRGNSDDSDF